MKPYLSPRLSPGLDRLVLSIRAASRNSHDVWVYEILRGSLTRLTAGGINWPTVWSPDGKRLVFASNRSGGQNLYMANADGSGQIERLTNSEFGQWPSSWSAQGNLIAFLQRRPGMNLIWTLAMDGDRTPKLFLESSFFLAYPEFSPDGRWIVYTSSESGAGEVYVRPYPGPGEKHRISIEGGSQPIWTANGREILYRYGQKAFSVAISSLEPFRAQPPRLLFEAKPDEYSNTTPIRSWDVSHDGQRFLLARLEEPKDKPVSQLQIVLNWTEELRRRAPSK